MMLGSRMSCVRAHRPVVMGQGASMHQLRGVVGRLSTTSIPRGSHQEALRKSIRASVIQIDRSTATTWADDDGGSSGGATKRVPKPTPSKDIALQFIELFNRRDIPSLLDMIADDCEHHNLAYTTRYTGKREIVMFYYDFINTIPEDVTIRVEDVTAGDPHKVGVSWTMELGRMEVPGAKGVSFYRINDEGKICYMRESPEHFVKAAGMALPALNALSPLMRSMGTEAAKFIQQAGVLRGGASDKRASPPIPELLSRLTIQGTSVADVLSGPPPPGSGSSVNSVASVGDTSGRDHNGAPIEMMQLADTDAARSPQDSAPSEDAEPGVRVNLTGIWYKDKNDKVTQDAAYDKSMALLQLSKIQKETGKMIDSLDIKHTAEGRLSVGFITPVPYFQVVETYQLGETVLMGRRDLRKGKTTATMRLLDGGARGYVVDMTWPEPLAGSLEEVYTLLDDNTMTIQSTIRIGGAEEAVTFTYRRG